MDGWADQQELLLNLANSSRRLAHTGESMYDVRGSKVRQVWPHSSSLASLPAWHGGALAQRSRLEYSGKRDKTRVEDLKQEWCGDMPWLCVFPHIYALAQIPPLSPSARRIRNSVSALSIPQQIDKEGDGKRRSVTRLSHFY
jgi:hypothetical protein